jgi:hypothetical protein
VIEKSKPKSKPRAKFLLQCVQEEKHQGKKSEAVSDNSQQSVCQIKHKDQPKIPSPATPIPIMQRVGRELGISPDKLTKELLEADPTSSETPPTSDD